MNASALHQELKRIVRRGKILTSPAQLLGYDADGLGYKSFPPDAVVIPADADELVAIIAQANRLSVPVTMRGAGTSLSGGPVAAQRGLIVHTSSMRSIRQIETDELWCEVECSVTLKQLENALKPLGLFYPPDPSSGPVCTIGGNVAMNAGGAHCFRFGVTSNYVLGLEAVLLDGSVHRFGGPGGGRGDWRDDWKRLMIGSEGTLAAFTRFWLRLLPRPEKEWTFQATFPDLPSAEKAIHDLVAHSSFPVAIELMDPRFVGLVEGSPMAVGLPKNMFLMVTEIDGPAPLVDHRVPQVKELLIRAGAKDVDYSDDATRRQKLWKARKVAGGLMGQLSPDFVVQDAVIPKRSLADVLQMVYEDADAVNIPVVNVFHAGDGNLHPNFLFDSRNPQQLHDVEAIGKRLMKKVIEVGGTLSGEHGIGNDKTAYMPLVFGPDSMRLQLSIPAIFNREHVLNPLKMFAQRSFGSKGSGHQPAADQCNEPATTTTAERFFDLFVDEIDGLAAFEADTSWESIQSHVASYRLRFPLVCDASSNLIDHLKATSYAPASSRFGPFCDNIVGMNWMLPSGREIRVGERVAKTTTGYDLLRFLLHSNGTYGYPRRFVVRLRPDSGNGALFQLTGTMSRVREAFKRLSKSCWTHWFDAIDWIMDPSETTTRLRLFIQLPGDEISYCQQYIEQLSLQCDLANTVTRQSSPPQDGIPDLFIKSTSGKAIQIAEQLAMEYRMRSVVICGQGVIHGYLEDRIEKASLVGDMISKHTARIVSDGGEINSRHLPTRQANQIEASWISRLEKEFASR
jgi:glycolate oxidase subunit GlcD